MSPCWPEGKKATSAVGCSHESVCARAPGSLLTLLIWSHTKLKWLSWIQHLLIISEHKCGTEWRHSIASSSAGRTLPRSSPSAQHDSTSAGHAERRNNMRHKGAMLTEAGGYGKGELKAHEQRGERRKEKLGWWASEWRLYGGEKGNVFLCFHFSLYTGKSKKQKWWFLYCSWWNSERK